MYFAQGMPFGFQATALPVYLREQGASLGTIGMSADGATLRLLLAADSMLMAALHHGSPINLSGPDGRVVAWTFVR